ncbi:hypothetical protein BDU57DRAFT_524710 [Ampelomyces quisqualis]|uniref:EthD domain-containing protein n=1 Tax=Ampelomyces quisqualis TaxID=50730 RepID=A0A6A5Q6L9_AMPQU|nr:hypothetical protein BDU57DRAFT_524710 [Ampelomyces quisqualis]
MSRLALVWTDLADDTNAKSFYQDTHIPNVVAKLGITARHAEVVEEDIFKEVPNIEGRYMTVYDVPLRNKALEIDAYIQLDDLKVPKTTKADARIYDECANWFGEEWAGHARDVQMLIIVLWQPDAAVHDEVIDWLQNDFVPGMLESPELLRTRFLKLQHASIYEDGKSKTMDTNNMYQYMTIWEFDCEDLPWEIMVYLGSSKGWRHYMEGGYMQWQMTQYLTNRTYPEDKSSNSPVAKRASIRVNSPPQGSDAESPGRNTRS